MKAVAGTSGIKATWKALPFWIKAIIIVIVLLIIFRLLSQIKGFITNFSDGATNKGAEAGYAALGEQPSYSKNEYKAMADRLEKAMAGPGTKEDEIFEVIEKLNNNIDAVKLNAAFGVREYSVAWWTSRASLLDWLEGDLDQDYLDMIWDTLEANNITYRFT